MSRGKNLQEMEAGTKQSRTAVNAGAKSGDPMQKLAAGAVAGQTGSWEDLGGPTPQIIVQMIVLQNLRMHQQDLSKSKMLSISQLKVLIL